MVRQKNINLDAKISNQDLEGRFAFVFTGHDGYGEPILELAFDLIIKLSNSGVSDEISRVIVDDVLTVGERNTLNQLLIKLRDGAFDAAGFNNV